ncbi:MAG: hypothetical protein LUD76_10435 [Alistipes sp.]|nr:hypothetical protein [Alistipes sp.]
MLQEYLVILTGIVTAAYIVAKAVKVIRQGRRGNVTGCTGCTGCPPGPSRGRGKDSRHLSDTCSPHGGCH